MIRFCSQEDISQYHGFVICHNIEISDTVIISRGETIDDNVIEIINTLQPNKLMVVSDKNTTKKEVKDFIINNFNDIYLVEFDYLNKRYNYLFNKDFKETMLEFFKISIISIDAHYLLQLLTMPVVLRKSIDLSIMSFYFALKMKLTPREIEDVFISSILCNLSLCKTNIMSNIDDMTFLFDFKKLSNNSYELVKEDVTLSNNVKRILRYFNENNYSKNIYTSEDDNREVLKDPTLEIIQLTNDLLSYNFENNNIFIYSNKYTQIQPAIFDFFKNMKNMKHRIKIQKLRKKLRIW